MSLQNNGVEPDFNKAKSYFEKSTEQGKSAGVYYYEYEYDTEQEYSKAFEYFQNLSETGNSTYYENLILNII